MGQLRDRMAEDLKLRRYKPSTCDKYLRCARAFAAYHRRPPEQMGVEEARAFLLHLTSGAGSAPRRTTSTSPRSSSCTRRR